MQSINPKIGMCTFLERTVGGATPKFWEGKICSPRSTFYNTIYDIGYTQHWDLGQAEIIV